mgnify:CR=1 FL=1
MENVADKIVHKFISHAVDLSRFEEDVKNRVLFFLKKLYTSLAEDINLGLGTSYSQAKLRALKSQVRQTISTAYKKSEKALNSELAKLAPLEQIFTKNAINSGIGADLLTTSLAPDKLKAIINKTLILGAPSADFWARQPKILTERFMTEMQIGIARGEPINVLVQRIRGLPTGKRIAYKTKSGKRRVLVDFQGGVLDLQTRGATAMVRTSLQTIANKVRHETFQANDDIIKGQQWLSTLDQRTTPICQALDGLEWDLEGNPIGGHTEPFSPPPAHWNCRSTLVPILKSWDELSKSKSPDLRKKLQKAEKNLSESERASMDHPVSSRMNYTEWFNKQSKARQIDILGPGKFEIFKKGKLSFRDMIDQTGNPLTIKELQKKI